jgi:hypothetical protein
LTTIITLMWGDAWDRYGKNFAESLDRYWPKDVDLVVVSDRDLPLPRGCVVSLDLANGLAEFRSRWREDRKATGFDSGFRKVDGRGYSWRHDAVKWAPQAFAPEVATADLLDGELAVWFDADVLTHKEVPEGWVDGIIGDADLCHLGRRNASSELGFWAVRLSPLTRSFLGMFANAYRSDRVFRFAEQHSGFVFDQCLPDLIEAGVAVKNLTAGMHGHVWPDTILGKYTAHLKGRRKETGFQP